MEGAFDFSAPDWLFRNLLKQESGNRDILGPLITAGANKGDRAFGPAQLMPKTASDPGYGVRPFDANAEDPVAENRRFGKDYLDAMLKEFGGDKEAALIAYNAGPGNAAKWVKSGRDYGVLPDRKQTEAYAKNILGMSKGDKTMDVPMPAQSGGAFDAGGEEPWMSAFTASDEAKTPFGQFLMQQIADKKKELGGAGKSDFGDKFSNALYHAGIAMLKAGGRRGVSTAQAIGEGLGGAATGLSELEKKGKDKSQTAKSALTKLQMEAAKLATPSLKKSGKNVKFKDLMKLVKDENAGILDPAALRKAAVQYGYQIKDDPFGSAYLQQAVKELATKAEAGELSEDEKAELEALTEIFKDAR